MSWELDSSVVKSPDEIPTLADTQIVILWDPEQGTQAVPRLLTHEISKIMSALF